MRRIALIAPLFLAMGVFASEEKPVERSYTTAPSAPRTTILSSTRCST